MGGSVEGRRRRGEPQAAGSNQARQPVDRKFKLRIRHVGAKYRCRALRNLEMSGRRAVKGSQEEHPPGLSLFAPALSREG